MATISYRRLNDWVKRRHHPARNIEIRALLDTFFVCAIATILIIRLQLWATHYPKLGGGKLHVAHLLWGGLAMLIAIVVLLSFLGQGRRHTAAILGGIGFGFFIDEIGKFVTSDNDYFFKPAAGMIYIVFILLFLAIRMLGWRHRWSPHECLTNAMEMLATARLRPLSVRERQLIGELLARSDPHDPLVAPLSTLLHELGSTPPRPPGPLARFANRLRNTYYRVAEQPGFALALVVVFGAVALVTVAQVVLDARRIFGGTESLHVIGAAGLASSLVAAGMIWIGIVHRRLPLVRSRAPRAGVLHRGVRVPSAPVRRGVRLAAEPRAAAGAEDDDSRRVPPVAAFAGPARAAQPRGHAGAGTARRPSGIDHDQFSPQRSNLPRAQRAILPHFANAYL